MNSTLIRTPALSLPAPHSAKAVLALMRHLQHGRLDITLPGGQRASHGSGGPLQAIRIEDWAAFGRILHSGDIGFAEGYIAGEWESEDLTGLIRLMLRNRQRIERLLDGVWWARLVHRIRHALHRNTRRGSARNIHAHYDLGNAFYSSWLDETMNYSSAWFEGDFSRPLEGAQRAKMRRALGEVQAAPGSRVLEIGCGWGALAEIAAREFDVRLTGITLSREQLAWARQRLLAQGLADRCDLRLQDYRDLASQHAHEPFDAIVSIEMFEAVGHAYWDDYFRALHRCLKPGGRACLQSITIRDDLFDHYLHSTDFIQQYIFPGGLLPSIAQFEARAARHGFAVERRLSFGADYAETLRRWHEAFARNDAGIRALGFDERFMRTWRFYLCYCEAAFAEGNTDVVQFTLRRD